MFTTKWTDEKIEILREKYHNTRNDDLISLLGLSMRTIQRKAKEIGVEKDPEYIRKIAMDGLREIDYLRLCGKKMGPPKGLRCNPKGEFKKGHKEDVYTRATRIAAIRAAYEMKRLKNG